MKIIYTSQNLDKSKEFEKDCILSLESLEGFFAKENEEPTAKITTKALNDRVRQVKVDINCCKGYFKASEKGEDIYDLMHDCVKDLKTQLIKDKKNNRKERVKSVIKHTHEEIVVTEDPEFMGVEGFNENIEVETNAQ